MPLGRVLTGRARHDSCAMIHDVDESLRALVRRDALSGSRVEIAFDAPTRDWSTRQNAPTVNLYLYDIREDRERREVAWEPVRNEAGIVTEHRPPARRFRLSYLITAWTQRPEDEHRLLSAVLASFLRHPYLPSDVLAGALLEAAVPILVTVALPPPPDRSLADVWSALGGELKPSLDLVISAPMDADIRVKAAPPVREEPRIRVLGPDGMGEDAGAPPAAARRAWPVRSGVLTPGEPAAQEESRHGGAPVAQPARPGKRKPRDGASDKARVGEAPDVPGRRVILRGIRRP